jgi:predicted SAM-dependent methyltransferase
VKDGMSLNLGCGELIFEEISGYKCINIDIRQLDGVSIVCDVSNLPFPDEFFDRILASDILEHFPVSETENLLSEWSRVLKVGGNMKFRTPSLRWVAAYYQATGDAKFVSYHIFGGQGYKENFHYVIFDNVWLTELCGKFDMEAISYKENHSNFELVVTKK